MIRNSLRNWRMWWDAGAVRHNSLFGGRGYLGVALDGSAGSSP